MSRSLLRNALAAWGRTGLVPGYQYVAIERYGPALGGGALLRTTLPNGCRIACDLRDHVQRHQWFLGAYEPIESYLFTRLLRPGMTVFDVGANVGQYSLLAATAVGPGGSVHAFEPVPRNFDWMRDAVEQNDLKNVQLNRVAAWSESKTLRLELARQEGINYGSYSVFAENAQTGSVEATAIRLDDYVAASGVGRVDLIKMDVEGAEPDALQGARAILERDRPIILLEVRRDCLTPAGSAPAVLAELLGRFGYRTWRIGLSAASSGPLPDVSGIECANVILHQDDLPPEVTGGWDLRSCLRWARGGW